MIHSNNCENIKAKIIVEGINGCLTPEAHNYLTVEKGVLVIPDIITTSGSELRKYFEWIRNLTQTRKGMNETWDESVR